MKRIGNIYGYDGGSYAGNVYDTEGCSPTLTDMQVGGRQPMVVENVGNIYPSGGQNGNVYNANGIAPTIASGTTNTKGNGGIGSSNAPKIVETKTICRMVGRNPDNPTDRTVGIPTEQRLEPNAEGICNCLTSVQKDNMVLEVQALDEQNMTIREETVGTLTTDGSSPKHNNRVLETVRIREATKKGYAELKIGGVADLLYPTSTTRRGRVQDMGETCPTIVSGENGLHRIESMYRIRKLTPKECWRLMDFSDEDFHKAEQVNSNTQLYKQAGNSIVKNCLVAIFGQMIPGKENVYKERFDERKI